MKTATIVLAISRGQTIVKTGVTPAQLEVLVILHMSNAGGDPVKSFVETEPITRRPMDEISRLRRVYGQKLVKSIFGPNSPLPTEFEDALAAGKSWAMENPTGESEPLVGRTLTPTESAAFIS